MVHYATGRYQLLPNTLPTVGHLDDAIAVEAAWPSLQYEVASFLDYCRVRSMEASLRGRDIGGFNFSRDDWEDARQAEYVLERQRRCIAKAATCRSWEPDSSSTERGLPGTTPMRPPLPAASLFPGKASDVVSKASPG
jgi:hypothetical protein